VSGSALAAGSVLKRSPSKSRRLAPIRSTVKRGKAWNHGWSISPPSH